jgi:RNA polymerase sigma factor (sigma-70 family)
MPERAEGWGSPRTADTTVVQGGLGRRPARGGCEHHSVVTAGGRRLQTSLPSERWPRPPLAHAVPRRRFRRSSPGDKTLMREIGEGSPAAFEALCELHYRPILKYCRGMLRSRQDAEDAVQETFLSAYKHLVGGDRPSHLRAWLYAIARNHCLMRLRRRKGEGGAAVDVPSRDLLQEVEERSDFDQLITDLRELPEEQREALVLFELGDLPQAHIAERLGCDATRVKSLVFQARTALREMRCAGRAGSSLLAVIPALRERLLPIVGGSNQAGGGPALSGPALSSLLPAGAAANLAIVGIVVAGAGLGDRLVASSGSSGRDHHAVGTVPAPPPGSPGADRAWAPRQQAREDAPTGISWSWPSAWESGIPPLGLAGDNRKESLPRDRDSRARGHRERPDRSEPEQQRAGPSHGSHDRQKSAGAERRRAARAPCPGGPRCTRTEQQPQGPDRPPPLRGGQPAPGKDGGLLPPAPAVLPPAPRLPCC